MADAKKLPKWQTDFVLAPPEKLVHGDVVKFERALYDFPARLLKAKWSNVSSEAFICAAIVAKWIASPKCEILTDEKGEPRYMLGSKNISEMHAGKVRWYGTQISNLFDKVTAIPPN